MNSMTQSIFGWVYFLGRLLVFAAPLGLVGLALWVLKSRSAAGRRTLGRSLALAFLVLCVTGLGLCGAWGTGIGLTGVFAGEQGRGYAMLFFIFSVPGLIVAGVLWWLVRKWKKLPAQPQDGGVA